MSIYRLKFIELLFTDEWLQNKDLFGSFCLFPKAQSCSIEKFWRLIKSQNLHSFLKEHHCVGSKLFTIIITLFYLQSLIFNWKNLTSSRPVKDALLLGLIPEFSELNVFPSHQLIPKKCPGKLTAGVPVCFDQLTQPLARENEKALTQ